MSRASLRLCLALVTCLASSGCASVDPITGLTGRQQDRIDQAVQQVAFVHPDCPKTQLKVARVSPDGRHIEISVCGGVRRYQDISPIIGGSAADPVWIDVTAATVR